MHDDHETLTLVQLTDVHLGPLPAFLPRHWNVKRLFGYVNFRTTRRDFHEAVLANAVTADAVRQCASHIVVTGDLVNLGMPEEFEQALAWLETVGTPGDVTVIPGNHDVYTRLRSDPGIERWRPYMSPRGEEDRVAGVAVPHETGFPFVRTIGRFALIGLNSAVYMPPGVPAGRLGDAQIERFVEIATALAVSGFMRIVLVHHPPLPEHGQRRGLRDAGAFEDALIRAGAEIVLHGHNHRQMISWRETRTGPAAIIGAPSAGEGYYNLYRIEQASGPGFGIERITRGVPGPGEAVRELERVEVRSDN